MAEPLKHLIGPTTARDTEKAVTTAWPDFDGHAFLGDVLPQIETLELMQRGQLIATALGRHLPDDFPRAAAILAACLPANSRPGLTGWALLSFNQYVAAAGRGHTEAALALLKALTSHFTAEFGIRRLLLDDQENALSIITGWLSDPDHHVRRLASEGTRPRLPWALRLPALVRDPAPILPILTALVDDPEDYVRRSVANSLNDIAKDHPEIVADFVARHAPGASKERLALLRHASRTLIKNGHAGILGSFGFSASSDIVADLALAQNRIAFPGELVFTLTLTNQGNASTAILLDYAIHHRKKNGLLTPKVFKGRNLALDAGQTLTITLRHTFRPITTRVYHPGAHAVEIMLNGRAAARQSFELDMP